MMLCYLIERYSDSRGRHEFLGSVAMLEGKRWFTSSYVAIKFADIQSAETVAKELMLKGYNITQHQFGLPEDA